eukprot:Gb_31748 [translate_table: standard]
MILGSFSGGLFSFGHMFNSC